MKRSVEVVKTVEYDIEIDDSILNQEFVDSFESGFWELDGDTLEEKIDGLFKVAAYQLMNGEAQFIEGVGACCDKGMQSYYKEFYPDKEFRVLYKETYEEIETEIVP
jgi:hypothetical protein